MQKAWPLAVMALAAGAAAQEAIIRPGDNLVVEGIPPLPASLAEEVRRYTEFRSASFQSWHPRRREMLISTRFGDATQVHHLRAPGGARYQLTFSPEPVGGASFQPTRGEYFLFTRDRGGDEFWQLYRYDLAGGAITRLSDGGRSQNSLGAWSTAGDRVAYGSTRRNGRDRDVFVVRPEEPPSDRMLMQGEGGGWWALDWSPDDTRLAVMEFVSANESYLWLVDAAGGQRRLLTPKGGPVKVSYSGGEFAGDGRGLYVTTDRDSEYARLAHVELATGKHTYLTSHLTWDVESFDVSPDGRTLAFVTNENGASVLRLLDTSSGRERPAPALGLPLGVIGALEWAPDSRELAFTFSSARTTGDVYTLDTAGGKVERWTESETGGLDLSAFPEPELVRWRSFDGREISGFLYSPPARFRGPRPVLISIHGGPESQARPRFLGRSNYYLHELGVAVLYPNVRGSSGYGKTFLALDNGERREDSVKDVGALLEWIATRPDLDAGRVMVTGGSYGGYMTLAVAAHYADRIRAALDVVGISSFVTFLERTEPYRRDLRRAEYGDERDPAMREFLTRISPLSMAHRIRKPLFVVQGRNDPRVPVGESEQIVAAARRNGTPVWYLMAKDEGHGFDKKSNQDFQFYATVLFMRQHLLP